MIVKNSEKKENNRFEIQVATDAAEFEKAINTAYNKMKKDINIPGFRKGKAPRKVVEGIYGAEAFYQDAMDELAPAAFDLGISESKVRFVGAPSIVSVNVTEEKSVEYVFSVELYPEVTLGEYKNLGVEVKAEEVTDEKVDEEIKSALKRNARKVSVDDRAAQMGDTVNIDFDGYLNGEQFDGGKAEGYSLELGSNSFVPGFEEQVVGMQIGEEKDLDITFPEDYVQDLAGKAVVFKVKLNEITFDELPELDDEFAKDNGFDTLDEYKASVRSDLEGKAADMAETTAKNEAMMLAINNMTVSVPEVMINDKVEEIVRNYAANYGMADRSVSFEDLKKMMGLTDDVISGGIRPSAESQVKTELLLEAVAAAENIEITDEDTAAYIKNVAETVGADEEQIKTYFGMDYIVAEQKKEKAQEIIFAGIKAAE